MIFFASEENDSECNVFCALVTIMCHVNKLSKHYHITVVV